MLLSTLTDLRAIFPQSQWDKISTLLPLFTQTERTHLLRYLGSSLLIRLNQDATSFTTQGIQSSFASSTIPSPASVSDASPSVSDASVSEASASASSTSVSDASPSVPSTYPLPLLSSCQRYIAYLTFANNVRIFSSSFNRGGGVNRAFSEAYDTLEEKDFAALSKELYMSSQDALEDILLFLEEDAKTSQVYTSLWKQNTRYFYHHAGLLFPTALSLNPYYDINERREKYQSLVPTIESCQRRYLLPNMGKSLYNLFLAHTNSLHTPVLDASPSPDDATVSDASPSVSDTTVSDASASASTTTISDILSYALPDLLHSLAYYIRADLTTAPKTQQEQHQYLLRAEQHRNLALRTIIEEPTLMKDYICGTPLDSLYAELNQGKTLTQELASQSSTPVSDASASAPTSSVPTDEIKSRHNTPYILDLTS